MINRRIARHTTLALIAPAVALSLAGCGDAGGGQPIGHVATVGFYPDSGVIQQGTIDVAVTKVEQGTASELAAAGYNLDQDQLASTPYYVTLSLKNNGTVSDVNPPDPSGESNDGTTYSAVVVIGEDGTFQRCPGIPYSIPAGATVTGCSIVLVPPGGKLDRISYFPGGSEDFQYWNVAG